MASKENRKELHKKILKQAGWLRESPQESEPNTVKPIKREEIISLLTNAKNLFTAMGHCQEVENSFDSVIEVVQCAFEMRKDLTLANDVLFNVNLGEQVLNQKGRKAFDRVTGQS